MSNPLHIDVEINEEDENSIRLALVGDVPYVLIRVLDAEEGTEDDDEDRISLGLEVGGGAAAEPAEGLTSFLRHVADVIDLGQKQREAAEDTEDDDDA